MKYKNIKYVTASIFLFTLSVIYVLILVTTLGPFSFFSKSASYNLYLALRKYDDFLTKINRKYFDDKLKI